MTITRRTSDARLLRLAAFLRKLPRKRFDYNAWVGHDWKGDPDLSCGTTACALGWATTIPSLRRAGLRLKSHVTYYGNLSGYVGLEGKAADEFHAASEVFGISVYDAGHLFAPRDDEQHATPKQVARKIESFVTQRVEEP